MFSLGGGGSRLVGGRNFMTPAERSAAAGAGLTYDYLPGKAVIESGDKCSCPTNGHNQNCPHHGLNAATRRYAVRGGCRHKLRRKATKSLGKKGTSVTWECKKKDCNFLMAESFKPGTR